jgi:hypothetical protein
MEILLLLGLAVAIGVLIAHFSRYLDAPATPRSLSEDDRLILSVISLAASDVTPSHQPSIDCGHGSLNGGNGGFYGGDCGGG